MDQALTTLINSLSSDVTNSLRSNFNIFIESNRLNNKIIHDVKDMLMKLPEYAELNAKYAELIAKHNQLLFDHNELLEKYNALKESKDNICINVNEVSKESNVPEPNVLESKIIAFDNKVVEKNTLKFDLKKVDEEEEEEEEEEDKTKMNGNQ